MKTASEKVSIISLIIALAILLGWYLNFVPFYFLILFAVLFLTINVVGSVNIKHNYFIYSHCKSKSTNKTIVITFDDGPHPEITPKLIDLLDLNSITATFFCTGKNADSYSSIIKKSIKSNHIIGNHSYGHSYFFDLFSPSKMRKEISDTNITIQKITGKTPLLFRPPYGITNPMLRKALKRTPMLSIGWSLRSLDTMKSSDKVLAKLKANTKAGDIVLFHDTNPNIVSIIEDYLIWLRKNDFKIVSLTDLLNISAYAN